MCKTIKLLFLFVIPLSLRGGDLMERIDRASDLWIHDSLISLHQEVREILLLDNSPENRLYLSILDYWLSGYYLQHGKKDSASIYMQEVVNFIEEVPEENRIARDWAFLGYFYNSLIPTKGFFSAPGLSKKAGRCFKRAFEMDVEDPIIHLLKGISLYYTPGIFGGGAEKALKSLNKALELYEGKANLWGHKVALLYNAFCLKKLKREDEALEVLDELLSKYPDFGWAKGVREKWRKEG
jgi:tetratricopeptide (TPR) repeat protein